MNENGRKYLIPANSKKSELYFGVFNTFDLILFCSGVGITILLMMVTTTNEFWVLAVVLIPALVVSFLVFPIPYYHNVMQLIINIYTYFFSRPMTYKWGGWDYKNIKKIEVPNEKVGQKNNVGGLNGKDK